MKKAGLAMMLVALATPPAFGGGAHDLPERPVQVTRTIPDTVRFDQEIAKGNLVHMTATNYGFYGNNFFSKDASLEYPANRGIEHMVRGGLWVGAHAKDEHGEFDGVTTGTVDAAQGPSSPEASEWTPGSRALLRRSTLPTSQFFDHDAVSELDVLADFNDFTPTRAASVGENHRSMSLEVHQELYQWNFAEFANILFFHIKITNRGPLLTNLWAGIYSEFASGNKGGYVNWPPSSSDPGGLGSWFNNKYLVFDDAFALEREHYCDAMPNPPDLGSCKLERAPYWIGLRYLGSKGLTDPTGACISASITLSTTDNPPTAKLSVTQLPSPAFTVKADGSRSTDTDATPIASYRFDFGDGSAAVTTTAPTATAQHTYASTGIYAVKLTVTDTGGNVSAKPACASITVTSKSVSAWSWSPGNVYRDEDRERYQLMSSGMIQPLNGDSLSPGTGDPVEVYSVGPFPKVYRDSSVTVDFAIVGGAEVADIQHNSDFAQFAYDHDYILPVPPPSPRFAVVARDTALDYYWNNISESAYDVTSPNPKDFEGYRVYIGEDPDTLARVAQFDADGDTASFNTGFHDITLPDSVKIGEVFYQYHYSVHPLRDGFKYYGAVTAFDIGNSQIEPLESGFSQNRILTVPAPAPGEKPGLHPTVFPNPYRVEARWDRGLNVRDHFLWFTGLPARCLVRIYTLAGDLVYEKDFDGATYHGEGSRGIYNPSNSLGQPTLSGSTFGWNLITREGQAAATGLYLFSVENRATGKRYVGKFLIVKSDREGS